MTKQIESKNGKFHPSSYEVRDEMMLVYADEFRIAADKVDRNNKIVKAYLYGHAIELYLKVYLLKNGETIKELRKKKYGHDIEALLTLALTKDLSKLLPISQTLNTSLVNFSNVYKEKGYEYFNILYVLQFPDLSMIPALRTFSKNISKKLHKKYFS